MEDTTTLTVPADVQKLFNYLKAIGSKRKQFEKLPEFDDEFWQTHEAVAKAVATNEATKPMMEDMLFTSMGGKEQSTKSPKQV